jgi:tetratricopeptide (TPR) repeat protein
MDPRGAPLRLLAVLLATLAAAPPALAGGDDADKRARAHFRRAETHFAVGRFKEALAEYEQAFEARPLPGFLFNIGQCHRNLGHLEEAIFSFKKYLRLKPDAKDRAAVEDLIADLERQLAAQRAVRAPPPMPVLVLPPPPPPPPRPFYTRTWFWGAAAVVVAASVVGVYFGTRPGASGPPAAPLGNIDFR